MTSVPMNLGGCVHTWTAEECAKLAHTETQCAEYAHAQDREQLKTQTATECLDRACSDKQQAWILEDRQLWAALAERDLKCPNGLLAMHCETMTPAQAYQYLSMCQHRRSNVAGTLFSVGCGRPVFPGTPYCRDHCYNHEIILCRSCQTGLVNVVQHNLVQTTDPFCRECMKRGLERPAVDIGSRIHP
jgi:hypothetical protein